MSHGVVRSLATAALVIACAVGGYSAASRTIAVVRVAGGSMAPALSIGDLCVVRKGAAARPGEVILFVPGGHASAVLHRVRSIGATAVVTQGDANPIPDFESVPDERVIGKVVAVLAVGQAMESVATHLSR